MQIALMADVHGNRVALEAVLRDIRGESVDTIVCLGDIAEVGAQPAECIRRLRELGCPVVLGNTDHRVATRAALTERPEGPAAITVALDLWTLDQLSPEDFEFVATMSPTVRVEPVGLLCYHGSPRSFNDRIVADTPDDQIAQWAVETAPIMAGGHTHQQMLRHWRGGVLVNPGSVGLPLIRPEAGFVWEQMLDETGPALFTPWAEYAVLEVTKAARSVALRRVRFDLDSCFEAARRNGMPHLEWWMSRWQRGSP
jgi:predicted phosphodiesterase